jgi:hypothetical protein
VGELPGRGGEGRAIAEFGVELGEEVGVLGGDFAGEVPGRCIPLPTGRWSRFVRHRQTFAKGADAQSAEKALFAH